MTIYIYIYNVSENFVRRHLIYICLKEMHMSFDVERDLYIHKLKNIVSGIEKINDIENSRIK